MGHPVYRRQRKIETFPTGKKTSPLFRCRTFTFVHMHTGTSTKCIYIYNHTRPNAGDRCVHNATHCSTRISHLVSYTNRIVKTWRFRNITVPLPLTNFFVQNLERTALSYIHFLIGDSISLSLFSRGPKKMPCPATGLCRFQCCVIQFSLSEFPDAYLMPGRIIVYQMVDDSPSWKLSLTVGLNGIQTSSIRTRIRDFQASHSSGEFNLVGSTKTVLRNVNFNVQIGKSSVMWSSVTSHRILSYFM